MFTELGDESLRLHLQISEQGTKIVKNVRTGKHSDRSHIMVGKVPTVEADTANRVGMVLANLSTGFEKTFVALVNILKHGVAY